MCGETDYSASIWLEKHSGNEDQQAIFWLEVGDPSLTAVACQAVFRLGSPLELSSHRNRGGLEKGKTMAKYSSHNKEQISTDRVISKTHQTDVRGPPALLAPLAPSAKGLGIKSSCTGENPWLLLGVLHRLLLSSQDFKASPRG